MSVQSDIAAAQTAINAVSDANTKAALNAVITALSNRVDAATNLTSAGVNPYVNAGQAGSPEADIYAITPTNVGSIPSRTTGHPSSVVTITENADLPDATHGVAYSHQLTASGGVGALSWSVDARTPLPAGLTLSSGGLLSGTIASAGHRIFVFTAVDSKGNGHSALLWLRVA